MTTDTLSPELLHSMDAYWRAANYLSSARYIYTTTPAETAAETVPREAAGGRALGHDAGSELHLCPPEPDHQEYDLDMFYIAGPGHGGPALVANTYLEGSYSEIYPDISQDEAGLKKLFTQFSFPGGISSHVAPTTPGSIHEGGDWGTRSAMPSALRSTTGAGRRLRHRRRRSGDCPWRPRGSQTSFSTPSPTGPCCRSCISMATRSAIRPSWPASSTRNWSNFFGMRLDAHLVEGDEPEKMHQLMAGTLETAIEGIRKIQSDARNRNDATRPRWPMIVLRSPRAGQGRRSSMVYKSRAPSEPTRCRFGGFRASRAPQAA